MDESFGYAFGAFICIVIAAFLSATETAVTSLSSLKTKHMQESHGPKARVLNLWLNTPHRVLASILIGSTLTTVLATILADHAVRIVFGSSSVVAVALLMTIILVTFSAILPKTIAKIFATDLAVPLLRIFYAVYMVLWPVTWIFSEFGNFLMKTFGKNRMKDMPQITEEELEFLIDVGEEEGVLAEQKHEMLSGVFELGDTVVREIMVHRLDMTAVPLSKKILDVVKMFRTTGLSRIPIYDERIDNIIGIAHAKDALEYICTHLHSATLKDADINAISRDPMFVPESKPVDELFQEMRKQRQHIAIVLDEYGGTSGLITMEDIIEEIVGEVRDEFDNEEDAIRPSMKPQEYLVECKVHVDDFCDFFDLEMSDLLEEDEASEFDTLGGLIFHKLGRIPRVGEKLEFNKVRLEVVDVTRRRVRRVIARIMDHSQPEGENLSGEENELTQNKNGL